MQLNVTSTTLSSNRYFAGPAEKVDHHGALLGVQLGAVHVEVEAVLVPDGGVGGGVELGAEVLSSHPQ